MRIYHFRLNKILELPAELTPRDNFRIFQNSLLHQLHCTLAYFVNKSFTSQEVNIPIQEHNVSPYWWCTCPFIFFIARLTNYYLTDISRNYLNNNRECFILCVMSFPLNLYISICLDMIAYRNALRSCPCLRIWLPILICMDLSASFVIFESLISYD